MPRTKLLKIKNYNSLANTFDSYVSLKGKWSVEYFKNLNPITLELGAGAADFSTILAKENINKNYIAIDIKADRLYVGAEKSHLENQPNIAFLRAKIQELEHYFSSSEVQDIWINFPDPHPKKRNTKHRLLNRNFLMIYKNILTKNSKIYFKTDSDTLFHYALEEIKVVNGTIIEKIDNLHIVDVKQKNALIKTAYEKKFISLGKSIKYICFSF